MGIEGDDNAVVLEMVRRRLEEKGGASKYPQQPWHRIVCACMPTLDPESGAIEMRALGGEDARIRAFVEQMAKESAGKPPTLRDERSSS